MRKSQTQRLKTPDLGANEAPTRGRFIRAGTRICVEGALVKKLTTCSPIDEEHINSTLSREIKRERAILVENA